MGISSRPLTPQVISPYTNLLRCKVFHKLCAASRARLLEGQEGQHECKHQDWSHVHELQTVLNGAVAMTSTSHQLCSILALRPYAFVWCSSWLTYFVCAHTMLAP